MVVYRINVQVVALQDYYLFLCVYAVKDTLRLILNAIVILTFIFFNLVCSYNCEECIND